MDCWLFGLTGGGGEAGTCCFGGFVANTEETMEPTEPASTSILSAFFFFLFGFWLSSVGSWLTILLLGETLFWSLGEFWLFDGYCSKFGFSLAASVSTSIYFLLGVL